MMNAAMTAPCASGAPHIEGHILSDEEAFSYEWWQDYIRNFVPATFMAFATPSSLPWLKTRQDWEQDMVSPRWVIPKEDPETTRKRDEVLGRLMEFVGRKAPEVAEMRKKLKK